MASSGASQDAIRALEYKDQGNKCFRARDFAGAEIFYTKAINHDPLNPQLWTNRANAHMQLKRWQDVSRDSRQAILLSAKNMKAYYYLAQAQVSLGQLEDAVPSALKAHELCVDEVHRQTKDGNSLGPITELVLRCKKERWNERENDRLASRAGLLTTVLSALLEQTLGRLKDCDNDETNLAVITREHEKSIEEVQSIFALADNSGEAAKREVPDWAIDSISFCVMVDPVVTKTGASYDRSSIMEHLRRSQTDPLTREPLSVKDIRPNLALREACDAFLEKNGWAADY